MAELPKEQVRNGFNNLFAAKNNKTDEMSALERLFYLINEGIKLNPDEYKINFAKIILLGFLVFIYSSAFSSDLVRATIVSTLYDNAVVKLDSNGNILWATNVGGNVSQAVENPTDKTIYAVGGGKFTKLSSDGYILLQKSISGSAIDVDPSDGSFYVGAYADWVSISKYDANGNFIKSFGGSIGGPVPVVYRADGSIYTNSYNAGVYKFDKNGNLLWQKQPVKWHNSYGFATIVVDQRDGSVVATAQDYVGEYVGYVVRFDINGNTIWTRQIQDLIYSRNAIDPTENVVYGSANSYGNKLYMINLTNGDVIWSKNIGDAPTTPSVDSFGGSIYAGNTYAREIVKVDKNSNVLWGPKYIGYYIWYLETTSDVEVTIKDTIPPISSISSPNKSAYSVQYIPINGTASQDTKKVEVQIEQVESKTYWDGKCWVGTPNWLLCNGTTFWSYSLSTYFSESLTYNIQSRATDISANVETPSNGITFVIDTKPPYSYFTLPEYNNKTYSDMPKICGQAADSKSGVAMVRVRLKDETDGTYWNGSRWGGDEIWLKMSNTSSFEMPVSLWKINHYYNVRSQAVDFAGLEESANSGYNFYIVSALKLSAKTSKQTYNYGEPVNVEISVENTSQSTQILELSSSKIYDFTIDSIYRFSAGGEFLQTATPVSFKPGITLYSENIDKIIPKGQHLLAASIEGLKLTSKYVFYVIADTIAPSVALQPVADGQYRYFSIPVAANISDNSAIKSVTLFSGTNSWGMLKTADNLWTGAIPANLNTSDTLSYYVEAVDLSGNKTITETKTISIKDVPAPKPEDITAVAQQEFTYLIGLKNFADVNGVYYRVYYDKGTGVIDESNSLGIITESTKTIVTPKLSPSTDYKFVIVPVTELSAEKDALQSSDIPKICIKTPPTAEDFWVPGGGIKIRVPLPPVVGISTDIVVTPGNGDDSVRIDDPIPRPIPIREYLPNPDPTLPKKPTDYYYVEIIPSPQPIVLDYIDDNQDGFLDGTFIKETTLVILRYDELEKRWAGGIETTVDTQLNKCFAFADREGKYALFSVFRIYPVPVSNLSGEATEKSEAKIGWQPSPSANSQQFNVYYDNNLYLEKIYSAKYRIYWDKGTGTVDYSNPLAELENPAVSFISNPLEKGLYKFAVRVVDIEGTEEKNTDYVLVNIGTAGTASASIRIPKDGKRLCGNAVTVIADATPDTTAVMFQYKKPDGKWMDISTLDKKPPYAVYWNLSDIKNGEYKVRAVAYDLRNLSEKNPAETTVYVDDVNWDISEDGNPSVDPNVQHVKQEKITETNETEVMTADGTGALIPEGIVEKENVLEIKTLPQENLPLPTASSLEPIGVFRDYTFSDGTSEFEKDLTILLPYPDENNDGIVDGTDVKTDLLEIYYLDEKNNEWKKADNRSGLGDGTNPGQGAGRDNSKNDGTDNPNNSKKTVSLSSALTKTVSAKVRHFTKFGIFAKVPKTNLASVSVYPNPFKPSKGHTLITFDGLTASIKIKIYTIAGRLADEFETETSGSYNWNPDGLASGVYIYYIENKNGPGSKKGKLAIIR